MLGHRRVTPSSQIPRYPFTRTIRVKSLAQEHNTHFRLQSRSSFLAGWGNKWLWDTWFDWIEPNNGNPIRTTVLKCVCYRKFETAYLIGFPLFDYFQSNHLSPEPLVSRASGPVVHEGWGALGTRMHTDTVPRAGLEPSPLDRWFVKFF